MRGDPAAKRIKSHPLFPSIKKDLKRTDFSSRSDTTMKAIWLQGTYAMTKLCFENKWTCFTASAMQNFSLCPLPHRGFLSLAWGLASPVRFHGADRVDSRQTQGKELEKVAPPQQHSSGLYFAQQVVDE